jgi:type IV secretion system protein VirB5
MITQRRPTVLTSLSVLTLLMASPAGAETVFDPSVFARQFEQLTELKKQVDTLTSQLKVAQDQLNQAKHSSMTVSTSGPTPTTSARS